MAIITPDECAAKIRSAHYEKLYLFYGRDDGALLPFAKKLADKLCPKNAGFMDLHSFDAQKLNMEELSDAVNVLPMFSERIVVTVSGFNMDDLDKSHGDMLRKILSDIPDTTAVIISAEGDKLYKNRKTLTDKNKRFVDFCSKYGDVCEFAYRSLQQTGKYIMNALSARGTAISRKNAEYLANLCLCETRHIDMEISKLAAFSGGSGEITKEDIDALCIKKIEADGFQLALNILNSNAKAVFTRLEELRSLGYEPTQIIAIINMSLSDIYRAKLAKAAGLTPDQCAAQFAYPKNRAFTVKYAFNDCANIPLERIRRTAILISDTEYRLKTSSLGSGGAFLALEQFAAQAMVK